MTPTTTPTTTTPPTTNVTYIGQALQDRFVSLALNGKHNGFFVEIGSNSPTISNNTYVLEKYFNWKGIMIEFDSSFLSQYKIHRPNSTHVIEDASKIDYKQLLASAGAPKNIDYLQVDLDVDSRSTLSTLENLNANIMSDYKFATVTFEHDIYTGNYYNTREISRKIFQDRGYTRIFSDVSIIFSNRKCNFEDWYVHPDLVNTEYFSKILTDTENTEGLDHLKCIALLKKYTQ